MAKATYWQRGETLDYPNASGSKIDANTIVVLKTGATGRIGVIGTDIPNGETGSVHVTGVYEMPMITAYWHKQERNISSERPDDAAADKSEAVKA